MVEIDKDLKNKITKFLENNKGIKYSIPKLCEELDIDDDFVMSSTVGELETERIVIQEGEKIVYREDGGEIHLVLHSLND